MTVAILLEDIVSDIAALSVAGVNIRDLDQIPENAKNILPVLFPVPNGFITDLIWTRESFGAETAAAMNLTYVLHYRYLHAIVGSGGGLLAVYGGMIRNIILILKAIFSDSSLGAAVDVTLNSISDIGVHTDPAGELQYHGVEITLKVTEYIQ